jgi:hypothetical protein
MMDRRRPCESIAKAGTHNHRRQLLKEAVSHRAEKRDAAA